MPIGNRVRQAHRCVALLFTLLVLAIFAALGLGAQPAEWVYYLPLPPLALLMLSGLAMLVAPIAGGRRRAGA